MGTEDPFKNVTPPPIEEEVKPVEGLPTAAESSGSDFTPEEIASAEQEVEQEALERRKVEVLSRIALEQSNETVDKMTGEINRKLGGRAESVNVWGTMRAQLANSVRQELAHAVGKVKSEADPNSMLGRMAQSISMDVLEGPAKNPKFPEDVAYDPGTALAALIESSGAELTGQELKDFEAVLELVTLSARHKFFSWTSTKQLETAIAAQEQLMSVNDEFDSARSGFFELRSGVQNSLAAIKLDLNSKPNYRYASPEYLTQQAALNRMLSGLSTIEARHYLRTHDIELEPAS